MPALPWNAIDTVLLDMDGTLLDLHFDNHFWLQHLPQRYAEHHGVSRALAEAELLPLFREHAGTLNWYCTDFWSRELNLSIRDLKREVAHLIALRPDADTFIQPAPGGQAGGHDHQRPPRSLSLKLERIELAPYFDRLISSHDYGFPKEDQQFWHALQQDIGFEPARTVYR
jgi:5'-nucleotidase